MNTSIPVEPTGTPPRIASNLMVPVRATIPTVRRPHGPPGRARWSDTVTESWETGVTLLRLASCLPLLGGLRILSALAEAADARHTRHVRK